jgi:ribosome maturation protein SDO1
MVTVDEAIIAKYEKDGKHFEILVDADIAYDLKEGKIVSLSRMLAVNEVFKDAKKADRAVPSEVHKIFGTNDIEKVAEHIVKHGDIQLTTDFRRKKIDERKKQISSFIAKNAINPQTKLPHPQDRILAAMDQAHVHVDPFRSAEHQVEDVIKAIKTVLPISVEQIVIFVEIPAQYSNRAYGVLKEIGMQQDKWLGDGRLVAKLSIPAGMKESIYRRIGNATDGTAKIEEAKQ